MTNQHPGEKDESLLAKAERALNEAVREALEENIRFGISTWVWENDQLIELSPEQLRHRLDAEAL